ncbi:MAG: Type secretion system protein, partial [Verrucomicrobiaceae bacterium]|nr:Type secretion system protein [Verrucomicrobiaceae bacterium]
MLMAPFRQSLVSPPRLWSLAILAVVSTCALHAQAPAGSPLQTLGTTPPPETAVAPGADGATIKVNFPNTPIMGIIPVYQQITGKKMILDGQLQGETLKIVGVRPMSKKEAVAFIEASLLLNGYAIIDKDPETVMLIHSAGGKSPTPEGLPVFSSIRDLPETEKIVHFVLPLQNISPDEATKAFTTVIKLHTYGAITPVNNTSNIIITE